MKTDKTKIGQTAGKSSSMNIRLLLRQKFGKNFPKSSLHVVSPFGKEPFGGQPLVLHFCYVLLSGYNSSVRLPT